MKGELSLNDYSAYLANLAHIYEALESTANRNTPLASSELLWDSRLARFACIEADLESLGYVNWRTSFEPTPGTQRYVAHLNSISGLDDVRLIAHHYTRYLGDLSGGQAISALVARHYGATPNQLSFYQFPEIDNIVRYKESYRDALDGLTLDDDQLSDLVAEVALAFELNQQIFDGLALASV